MIALPPGQGLPVETLSRVFRNTTTSYKFFWFLAILEIVQDKDFSGGRIAFWDIVARMAADAWHPITFFRLRFGNEVLYNAVQKIARERELSCAAKLEDVRREFARIVREPGLREALEPVRRYVVYYFLTPWLGTNPDRVTVELSQAFANGCLYRIVRQGREVAIELNPAWTPYLRRHGGILRDFTRWHLCLFLQKKNPNVPNIAGKLAKTEERQSLKPYQLFWNRAIQEKAGVRCIYTGGPVELGGYALDHFVPWRYVSEDLAWNLAPVAPWVNSAKSDRLPDLDRFLPRLAAVHGAALRAHLERGSRSAVLEDYLTLGHSAEELAEMPDGDRAECFRQSIAPMLEVAKTMGFEAWSGPPRP